MRRKPVKASATPDPLPANVIEHRDACARRLGIDTLWCVPPPGKRITLRGRESVDRGRIAHAMYTAPMAGGIRCSWPEVARALGYRSHNGARYMARVTAERMNER